MNNKINKMMAVLFAAMLSIVILSSAVNFIDKSVNVIYEAKYKPLLNALGNKKP
jgi:uncharacterized BrkB/YihY/UPF0761 family membrane protein